MSARRPAEEAVIAGMVGLMRAASGVTSLVTAVYNNVEQGAVYPYIEVTTPTSRREDTVGVFGASTLVDVKAITQSLGDLDGLRIRDQVIRACNNQKPTVSGHTVLGTAWENNDQFTETVNGIVTRHHIATFRVWTEQSST